MCKNSWKHTQKHKFTEAEASLQFKERRKYYQHKTRNPFMGKLATKMASYKN